MNYTEIKTDPFNMGRDKDYGIKLAKAGDEHAEKFTDFEMWEIIYCIGRTGITDFHIYGEEPLSDVNIGEVSYICKTIRQREGCDVKITIHSAKPLHEFIKEGFMNMFVDFFVENKYDSTTNQLESQTLWTKESGWMNDIQWHASQLRGTYV